MKVRANQGDTIDAICWRIYGKTKGMNELVLNANPGLASLGPVLPVGHEIELPDAPSQSVSKQVIQLWD